MEEQTNITSARRFRFGVFEADRSTGELKKQGGRVRIGAQPFEILCMLLERPGEVVTREEIQQRLWPDGVFVDFEHGVNAAVGKLRESLGDSAASPRYIETLARRGYRFLAPVEIVGEAAQRDVAAREQAPEFEASRPSTVGAILTQPSEVPRSAPRAARVWFGLIQLMFLSFYIAALANLHEIADLLEGISNVPLFPAVALTAAIGIPLRLFFLSAVSFGAANLRTAFLRVFPFVLVLDWLWAASPFLMVKHIGVGLALCASAALVYLPFSQRTLILMGTEERR